mmetsp:Transcript_54934/g.158007  ORF Transcript_54934/g.158007 Transcript_54934/m.158007 type:complete len:269 (-) Transcript_54934:158-964(-)
MGASQALAKERQHPLLHNRPHRLRQRLSAGHRPPLALHHDPTLRDHLDICTIQVELLRQQTHQVPCLLSGQQPPQNRQVDLLLAERRLRHRQLPRRGRSVRSRPLAASSGPLLWQRRRDQAPSQFDRNFHHRPLVQHHKPRIADLQVPQARVPPHLRSAASGDHSARVGSGRFGGGGAGGHAAAEEPGEGGTAGLRGGLEADAHRLLYQVLRSPPLRNRHCPDPPRNPRRDHPSAGQHDIGGRRRQGMMGTAAEEKHNQKPFGKLCRP